MYDDEFVDPLQEHLEFHYSTAAEWDQAEARDLGEMNPEQAWILTDRDVWHANPFYQGPPVPHPEDDYAHGLEWPEEHPSDEAYEAQLQALADPDDDIPF